MIAQLINISLGDKIWLLSLVSLCFITFSALIYISVKFLSRLGKLSVFNNRAIGFFALVVTAIHLITVFIQWSRYFTIIVAEKTVAGQRYFAFEYGWSTAAWLVEAAAAVLILRGWPVGRYLTALVHLVFFFPIIMKFYALATGTGVYLVTPVSEYIFMTAILALVVLCFVPTYQERPGLLHLARVTVIALALGIIRLIIGLSIIT
jgi:hypothetical protein